MRPASILHTLAQQAGSRQQCRWGGRKGWSQVMGLGAGAGGWCDRGTLAARAYLSLGAEAMSGMQKLYTSAELSFLRVGICAR